MARAQTGVLGGFSGRIGNVVSCLRHGKYYLRSLPEKVHHPNTEKQLAQRMRFTLVQQFLKPISKFIHLGFGAYAEGRSAYNAAMSYNLEHALTGSYPSLSIDYAAARVSKGNLPGVANATKAEQTASLWSGKTSQECREPGIPILQWFYFSILRENMFFPS